MNAPVRCNDFLKVDAGAQYLGDLQGMKQQKKCIYLYHATELFDK